MPGNLSVRGFLVDDDAVTWQLRGHRARSRSVQSQSKSSSQRNCSTIDEMEASMKKVLYVLLMLGWIPTLALVTGNRWITRGSVSAQGNTPVKVTRLYTGPDGKTKVEEFEIPLKPRDRSSDASGSVALTTLQVRRTNQNYFLDWHPASRRQLVVTLSGESEVELEGGRKIRLGPGHILLAEDTTGQGHISRAIGSKDRITLDIGLADGATLPH